MIFNSHVKLPESTVIYDDLMIYDDLSILLIPTESPNTIRQAVGAVNHPAVRRLSQEFHTQIIHI